MHTPRFALLPLLSAVLALSLTTTVHAQDEKGRGAADVHDAGAATGQESDRAEHQTSESGSEDQGERNSLQRKDESEGRAGADQDHRRTEPSDGDRDRGSASDEEHRDGGGASDGKRHEGGRHERGDVGIFFSDLQGHGSWLKHNDFDYVFVPQVERGWRPYVRGHWLWTDEFGWYWASDEPFAWATYHYGRWGYDPTIGWFWVPGNVWAPAWVTWRRGGGHVGWAPMGPRGRGYAIGFEDYYEPAIVEAWVFVPERRFVAVDLVSYVEPVVEVNTILRESRETFRVRRRGEVVVNEFLPRNEMAKIVDTDIKEYKLSDAPEPSKHSISEGRIETFRPELTDARPKEAPPKVVDRPDELKSKPVLSETAKGERPEGAPPSAAELKPGESGGTEGHEGHERKPGKAEVEGKPEPRKASEEQGKPERGKADGKASEEQGKPEHGKAEPQGKPEAGKEQGKPEHGKAEPQGKPEPGKASEEQGKKPEHGKAEPQGKPEPGKPSEEQGKPERKKPGEAGGEGQPKGSEGQLQP
jgi:hypothetical protein